MQVDNPAPNDRALWGWKRNIEEGQIIIAHKRETFAIFWQHNPLNHLDHNYVEAICSQRP